MLCIWLHHRNDLKMQYSVDICDVILIEFMTVSKKCFKAFRIKALVLFLYFYVLSTFFLCLE